MRRKKIEGKKAKLEGDPSISFYFLQTEKSED